ncbi:extracellular solute-binding protein [uncultured Bradyrhizobium sp.]|uniref:extracellular solute-binding protein n=1 Tax=Bradyrhizobium sp. TaxID=376 RepID=UPI0026046606|nr:extracellular solute-binding protein [uncultured Bradyrhizobium sp.]
MSSEALSPAATSLEDPRPNLGLTWDHPRGYQALDAAARLLNVRATTLLWERQPLEGFESHPIGELASRYDLLVLDHPHIGEAVALDCLVPLEAFFSSEQIAAWSQHTIGHAMASYAWQGQHWALPLDVATQVMALRRDLVDGAAPQSWPDVVNLSKEKPVALSVAGPHIFLCLMSIAVATGEEPGTGDLFLSDDTFVAALALLEELYHRSPDWTLRLNPIGLLEAMSTRDDLALVPLVYGYVNYTRPLPDRRPVAFTEAPAGALSGRRGSILGGTGIAITRRARPDRALLDHLAWLMSAEVQRGFIPLHGGQPSHREAWSDTAANRNSGQFYASTFATTEQAFVRPRFDGYIAFQNKAADVLRTALSERTAHARVIGDLRRIWRAAQHQHVNNGRTK